MLTRVLVAPPGDRLSMEDIKQHPWFLQGLPPGALDMNEFLLRGMEPFNLSMVRVPALDVWGSAHACMHCAGGFLRMPVLVRNHLCGIGGGASATLPLLVPLRLCHCCARQCSGMGGRTKQACWALQPHRQPCRQLQAGCLILQTGAEAWSKQC